MIGLSNLLISSSMALVIMGQTAIASDEPGTIHLTIDGMSAETGHVLIALYDSADGWNTNSEIASRRVAVSGDSIQARFEDISAGQYAVALFHDANDDGQFNMNDMGIPTESYGFSNNVFPQFRRANFEEARFDLESGDSASLNITLQSVF